MGRKKGDNINGWLVIDKSEGLGSTQVVNQTRYLYNAKKNGHAGTLDPFASGVLPIAFGEATKLIPYVMQGEKEYEFILKFGVETDTLDLSGKVVDVTDVIPTKEQILEVLPLFKGEIIQVPPIYSAIKINGERAYDLARKGETADIKERKIYIYEIELCEMLPDNQARFRVKCSKGTYVRTLGADIAKKLGSRGHLTMLRRTKCGIFDLNGAILLENLKKMDYSEQTQLLKPLLTCLCDITVIALSDGDADRLRKGQRLSKAVYGIEYSDREAVAVFDNQPVAVVRIEEKSISPIRVFNL